MSLSLEGTTQASITVDLAKRDEPLLTGHSWGLEDANIEGRAIAPGRRSKTSSAAKTAKATTATALAAEAQTTSAVTATAKATASAAATIRGTAANETVAAATGNKQTVKPDASASFGGCFKIGAGLDVNAGADANFFDLFDPSTKISLFSKQFEILEVRSPSLIIQPNATRDPDTFGCCRNASATRNVPSCFPRRSLVVA